MSRTRRLVAEDFVFPRARRVAGLALVLALVLAAPNRARAARSEDPPPTGRGLIISGSAVGGLGVSVLIPGIVFLITGRTSREGLATAIGVMLTSVGVIAVGTGAGLLAPGIARKRRYGDWKADSSDAFATRVGRIGAAPQGLVLRF